MDMLQAGPAVGVHPGLEQDADDGGVAPQEGSKQRFVVAHPLHCIPLQEAGKRDPRSPVRGIQLVRR